ncbi:plastocyanin/azurin family copper-binding protein [Halorubellus salinus]|uniref:plastocyanin/azurin family copper-binding protein n=1 Tax=Halorubellus salinus TaxID=755309 RepID=UPI001D06B5B9|nr:plastocyanin/azurin family copper-binding protein [Halorubellus salinus]
MPRESHTSSTATTRRPVLKTLAATGAVGALAATTLGADERHTGGTRQLASLDEHTDTVHTVETRIAEPSTNPNRPTDFFYEPTGLHVQPGDVVRWRFVTPDHNVVSMHPAYGMRRRVPLGVDAFSSPLLGFEADSIPGDMVDPPGMPGEDEPEANATATTTTSTNATTTTSTNATTAASPPNAGPVPATWLLAFDTPGVYDVICSPHEGFGMAMRVVVGDDTEAPFETSDPAALPEPRLGPVGLSRITLTDPALEPDAIVDAGTVSWLDLQANGGGDGDDGEESDGDDDTSTGTETAS